MMLEFARGAMNSTREGKSVTHTQLLHNLHPTSKKDFSINYHDGSRVAGHWNRDGQRKIVRIANSRVKKDRELQRNGFRVL